MKYYSDGFVRGKNPSLYGGGYTIVDENNNLIKREEIEKVGFTNNEGEILGILESARLCNKNDSISTDSMCCLSWSNTGKSKARADLNAIFQEVRELIKEKNINLMWERRDFNLAGVFNEKESEVRARKYSKSKLYDVTHI